MVLSSAIVLVAILLIALYGYFKYSFRYWKSRNVPCDEPTIPFGNMENIRATEKKPNAMEHIYNKYKNGGYKMCGVYFLTYPVAVLLDTSLIRDVLIKDFSNFDDRGFYYNQEDDPLSAHLFSLNSESWRKLRTKLTPTFSSGKMKFMFPTVVEIGERFRDCLSEIVKEHDEFNFRELFARYTTDVIGTCAFGIECNSLKDPNAEFRRYGRVLLEKPRHSFLFYQLLTVFRNIAKKFRIKFLRSDVAQFFMKVVRETVDYREKNNVQRNDLMDILIKLKNHETSDESKAITLNEVAAQAFLFFFAGFETSSTTLTFCLYELALNPDVQEKARNIVREAYKKHDGHFTYEMMMDMPYIDQVLHETLRKYPPVGCLIRSAKCDYQVSGTNIVIEKGIKVVIPVYDIQHDPEYYPEPDKFDPDRFETEEVIKRNPMTWLPFGDGPRNCIGLRFGMMQTRIGLVTLLNSFEFSLGAKMSVPINFDPEALTLSPKGGMYLKVKSIK